MKAEHKPQAGVRYCGGCNPRYDRVAVVKKLEELCPEWELVHAEPTGHYAAILVVNGCPTRCAKTDDLAGRGQLVPLNGWEDLLPVKRRLAEILEKTEARSLTPGEVLDLLPHREPILLIDEASHLVPGVEVHARFLAREDLPVFQGHFPTEPVFPGVYSIEAIAQAADILLLSLERYAGKTPLFMGVAKANFRRKILPGQSLDIRVALTEEREEIGVAVCTGQIFVEGKLAAEAEVTLALR